MKTVDSDTMYQHGEKLSPCSKFWLYENEFYIQYFNTLDVISILSQEDYLEYAAARNTNFLFYSRYIRVSDPKKLRLVEKLYKSARQYQVIIEMQHGIYLKSYRDSKSVSDFKVFTTPYRQKARRLEMKQGLDTLRILRDNRIYICCLRKVKRRSKIAEEERIEDRFGILDL